MHRLNCPPPAVPTPFPVSGYPILGQSSKAFHKALTFDNIGLSKLDLIYISMGTSTLDSSPTSASSLTHGLHLNNAVHGL